MLDDLVHMECPILNTKYFDRLAMLRFIQWNIETWATRSDTAAAIALFRCRSIAAKELTKYFIRCCTFGVVLIQTGYFKTKVDRTVSFSMTAYLGPLRTRYTCEASEAGDASQSYAWIYLRGAQGKTWSWGDFVVHAQVTAYVKLSERAQPDNTRASRKTTKGRAFVVYLSHKDMNAHLLASNMDSPRDMDDSEIPESEILDDTYKLESALETLLDHRGATILVCQGEVLATHRVKTWLSEVPVIYSRAPPVHAFDSERSLLAILNNTPHIPADVAGDAPTLDPGEYCKWLLDTYRKGQRSKDKEASKQRSVYWHQMRQDPRHEPEDCIDF
ncbi:hypothetical protein EDD18DRAFT_1098563 [Armillaria luteobubalina]|uniref:Uncharacterized protein n=1 Tax=Armillaria luteobubalina TaxID=153913 RepID=A0AA39QMQ5_9AGAR|nr:hypothetical protein EDD18DRAFT_1098563 [Armillaria luteobubalina]